MKNYIREIILLLIQLVIFYTLPLTSGPTDIMGMVVLMLLLTFILGIIMGIISNSKIKYFYPLTISLLFIPSIFIYYNISALVHAVWYLIASVIGILFGVSVKFIVKLIFDNKK